MKKFPLAVAILRLGLLLLTAAASGFAFQVTAIDGRHYTEAALQERKAFVLFFVATDCPISNRYAPEMNRLVAAYAPKEIAFWIVHTDPALTVEEATRHAREFSYQCPVIVDREHLLVKLTGARVTPEAAILSPEGRLLYRGQIDDTYQDYGVRRLQPRRREVRNVLEAILAGRTVKLRTTQAIGCFIFPD